MREVVERARPGRKPRCECGRCRGCKQAACKRALYQKNPEKFRARSSAFRQAHPKYASDVMLKKKYGLEPGGYEARLAEQGGVCAICSQPEMLMDETTGLTLRLAVDHDHETGEVRGLLCNNCNRALGLLKDSTTVLAAAIRYLLKRSQTITPESLG